MTHIAEDDLVRFTADPGSIDRSLLREFRHHVLHCRSCRTKLRFFEAFQEHLHERGYRESPRIKELIDGIVRPMSRKH